LSAPLPLQRIRDALREDAALPALGQAVANVSRIAAGDSDTVDQLAQAILSDVSLTQRLLRCANSALYRTREAAPVTTVSRALVLLGFDQIRSLALSMMLVDRLLPGAQSRPAMRDFGQALSASSIARCTLRQRWPACAEEAAIAAMFRNVGRLIVAVHAPEAAAEVRAGTGEGEAESPLARRVVGRSYEELTLEVVGGWGLPPRIEQSLRAFGGRPAAPRASQEWVRLASAFGDESASLERNHGAHGRERSASALARRWGDALEMEAPDIAALLAQAAGETMLLAQALGLSSALADSDGASGGVPAAGAGGRADTPAGGASSGRAGAGASAPVANRPGSSGGAGAAPPDAEAVANGSARADCAASSPGDNRRLLDALSRISEALTGSKGTGRVVQIATEGMRESLGAARALYFGRDDSAAAYRPRAAAGCELAALRGRIAMPVQFTPNLFHAALARGADLHIADIGADSVRDRLPPWLTAVFPDARGFLLLPVMVDGRPMGFFYADRTEPDAAPPDAAQLDAVRLLRNQVILALRTEPVAR
jgi:HD-like signal output (HDOD) protein